MHSIEQAIQGYTETLCAEIDVNSLIQRNPVAHKWKVTYQCVCLRETLAWRFVDLIDQTWLLHKNKKALGARILLRSAFETLAMLIFLNQLINNVTQEKINFNDFRNTVYKLSIGSRNKSTDCQSINILTIFDKCEKEYKDFKWIYECLSEVAHPNYDGLRNFYSKTNSIEKITQFSNHTNSLNNMLEKEIYSLFDIFECEYNILWIKSFIKLEEWLVKNESKLQKF